MIHIHTIKPLDEALILAPRRGGRYVFTVEEHTVVGGLGSAVVDLLIEQGPVRQMRQELGIPDVSRTTTARRMICSKSMG